MASASRYRKAYQDLFCRVVEQRCMFMRVLPTTLPEVKVIIPRIHPDERGSFTETYNWQTLRDVAGIDAVFVQDNQSRSGPAGVLRGLHFQIAPYAQGKLVRVVSGSILDVAVDIRVGSPTYGQHATMVLSAENAAQAWIPCGFAHGFCTLQPDTEVFYKVTAHYNAACDRGLAWDDPALKIAWPYSDGSVLLSAKDRGHPTLAELPGYFTFHRTQAGHVDAPNAAP